MAVTRRAVLGWMAGLTAGLIAAPAEAKPRKQRGVYSDVYTDRY